MIVPNLNKTKVFVAGGSPSVEAMVKALDTVDGVSLGRSACHEPDLPKKILLGHMRGALLSELDEEESAMTNIAAGTQSVQIPPRSVTKIDIERGQIVDQRVRYLPLTSVDDRLCELVEHWAMFHPKLDSPGYVGAIQQDGNVLTSSHAVILDLAREL